MPKLLPYPLTNNLYEIFQANDIKFTFVNPVNEDFQELHVPVKCREYFNEFLMINHHPNEFKFQITHGFNYKHKHYPYQMDATRMAIKFPTPEKLTNFLKWLPWLNKVEQFNNLKPTETVQIDSQTLIVIGDTAWIQKCLLLNIYTLLIKLMSIEFKQNKYGDNLTEIRYANFIGKPKFNSLLEQLTSILQLQTKYVDGTDTLRTCGSVHAYSGITTILKEYDGELKNISEHIRTLFNKKPTQQFITRGML